MQWPASVHSYDLPSVNLGLTSFVDGGPPAGPGLYFTQYIDYYSADEFMDNDGNKISLPNSHVEVWLSMTQLTYQSDQELIFGGKWGLNLMVPFVGTHKHRNHLSGPQDNGSGLGDILLGPFLQWGPIMGKNGPVLMHRIEFQMIFPTGKYDDDREINPGSNFFFFNPYWTATLFLAPRLTASVRLHYLWNDENNDPNRGFGAADKVRAGQAIHTNFTLPCEVLLNKLRLGLNGYYLKQITDTEVDGHHVSGRREQVLGIGPGGVFHFSKHDHLFFNIYFETETKNRTQGNRFNLRFVHHF